MLKAVMRNSPQWCTALAVIENNFGSVVFESESSAVLRVGPFVMVEGPVSDAACLAVSASVGEGDVVTSSVPAWYEALCEMPGFRGKFTRLERQTYDWSGNQQALSHWLDVALPPGVQIKRIDAAMAAALETRDWSAGIFDSYGSHAAFLDKGLGFCLLHNQERAAVCLSFANSSLGVEIEVDTGPGFEGRGYATLVSAYFIKAAQARRWTPLWDATNPASAAIARKLGFVAGERYRVLEFSGTQA